MVLAEASEQAGITVAPHGRGFRVLDHPVVVAAAAEFTSGLEEATLRLFDAVLPECDRMVDFGAYLGFTALYAASFGPCVSAFEASPMNGALLAANVALNPELRGRVTLHPHAVGDRDGTVTLYAKGYADPEASIFRDVERATLVCGAPTARVRMRDTRAVLEEIGVGPDSLLKIDIEGAEYQVLPRIAPLLAETRPVLHVSFHPFNIVPGPDEYANTVARLARAMQVAEALAFYRHLYCRAGDLWTRVDAGDRMDFLRHYLLRPKPVPRIRAPQYGFTDAWVFTDRALEGLAD